jgi:hypothetical protein
LLALFYENILSTFSWGETMKLNFENLIFPGKFLADIKIKSLKKEMKILADECFNQELSYQVLGDSQDIWDQAVITLARDEKGELLGFISALYLKGLMVDHFLHLGLTCVSKKARGTGITHLLGSKMLLNFLVKKSPFSTLWISNCACVLSSLGNVALHFNNVYPSPFVKEPSPEHLIIAHTINDYYRSEIAINPDAHFNEENFVFEGSVQETAFQKTGKEKKYYHRQNNLNQFYNQLINFKNGDEVLQIGNVNLLSLPWYFIKQKTKKRLFFPLETHPLKDS